MLKFLSYLIKSKLLWEYDGGSKRVEVLEEIRRHNLWVKVASSINIPGSFRKNECPALLKISIHPLLLESSKPKTSMVLGYADLCELWPLGPKKWL